MAQTQVIQGSRDELIAYLKKHKNQDKLTLIIPMEESTTQVHASYPEGAPLRNGVPLLPTEGRLETVTMQRIKQLMDEEA